MLVLQRDFQSRPRGFDSRLRHSSSMTEWLELVYTRRSERRALEAWEFESPLGHSSSLEA